MGRNPGRDGDCVMNCGRYCRSDSRSAQYGSASYSDSVNEHSRRASSSPGGSRPRRIRSSLGPVPAEEFDDTHCPHCGLCSPARCLRPTSGFAQVSCSREGLQRAVDLYIAAQTKGDTSGLPLATGLGYMENVAPADINSGLIKTAMKIDHHRSLLDPVDVSDVHRGDRHEQGEAVRPRHAPARQPRQDRRDRDPVDHDWLLAVQRRRLL